MKTLCVLLTILGLLAVSSTIVFAQPSGEGAPSYRVEENISYRTEEQRAADPYMDERCRLDLYLPTTSEGFSTVLWFHGGGLTGGEKFIPEELKNRGIAVAAVNYRLSPRATSPAYIDDAAAATAWVMKEIEGYGGDPNLVFVSGHSAGGYLASMIGLDKSWLQAYDVDADQIAGLIPFSGHTITHLTIRAERGIPTERAIVDELAPLYFVRADAPPFVFITGDRELELLGRYEENAYMARMMKVAGHKQTTLYELDGFDHNQMARPAFDILLRQMRQLAAQNKAASADQE